MKDRPKPKSNAVLKNLPEERRDQIAEWCRKPNDTDADGKTIPLTGGLAWARRQLAADGLHVKLKTVSKFYSWWRLEQDLDISFEREEQVLAKTGDRRKAREAGESLLARLGLAKEDPELILAAAKISDSRRSLDLIEESGKTKARQKERSLDQKDQEIWLATEKLLNDAATKLLDKALRAKADEINNANLSNADKIAAMRKAAFAEIDELQRSGKVVIPK